MVFTLRDLSARGPVKAPRAFLTNAPIPPWRWAALLAVVLSFAHGRLHQRIGGISLGTLLEFSGSSLVPVPSAFGLWTLIHLILFGYALAQLGENQRRVAAYDQLSKLVVLACVIASLQLSLLQLGDVSVTAAMASVLAVIACVAYARIHREIAADRASAWIGIPFSLLLGWSGLIAIAALDGAITTAGCPSVAPAVTLLAVAGGTAIYFGLEHRDFVLPGLVAWMLTAICAANRVAPVIASSALVVGAVCAAAAILIASTRVASPQDARHDPRR